MLQKLKISQKVYFLAILQLLLMIVLGAVSIGQMAKIGAELVDIAEKDIPLSNAINLLTEHQLEQTIVFQTVLFQSARLNAGDSSAQQKIEQLVQKLAEFDKKILKEIKEAENFVQASMSEVHSEEAKDEFRAVLAELTKIEGHYLELGGHIQSTIGFIRNNQLEALFSLSTEIERIEHVLEEELIALSVKVANFTLKSALQAEHDEQSAIVWMTVVFVIAVLFGMTAPFFIARAISEPVIDLEKRLIQIADGDGDLTVTLPDTAHDETGDVARAFNHFMAKLRKLISGTSDQADTLGESAEVALDVMQRTLRDVEQQRCETEQVATAVNQMSATTQEVANNANSAAEVTENVTENVVSGRKEALETQTIITQLTEEVGVASSVIQALVSETNKIGSVLDTIQGIAEQTNLLALNAAIEAARAGESGRGFAVVADEVRSLAQRTQTSTVDIQDLVGRLQKEANNAVNSMEKGSQSAQLCLAKATSTAQTFEKAAASVGQISSLNIQIAAAAEEQSMVAEEINRNLTRIKDVAEETTAGAKKTEQANQQIARSLIDLHTSLNVFQT